MNKEELKLLSNINTTETDYKAEVLVAKLIDAGLEEDKILITRKGGNNKDVAKDISKINTEFSGLDLIEYLYIYANRYGIYDSLPEGIFHQSLNRKNNRTQQDVLEGIRAHRLEEFHARRIFQPFEMAIDNFLIDIQIYEQRFDKAYTYENLKNIFEEHWDILPYLSVNQSLLFLKTIPLIPEASQSFEFMASIMSAILDCPVKIIEGKKSLLEVDKKERSSLRNMKMGINSVMGKTVKTDFADLDVIIGPTTAQQVRDFQIHKNNQIILAKFIEMIIPFDRNVNVRYEVFESEKKFRLSGNAHKAYLGVNTTI